MHPIQEQVRSSAKHGRARMHDVALAACAALGCALGASSWAQTVFQGALIDDAVHVTKVFPFESETGGGPPPRTPFAASMTATFANFTVSRGTGIIGGDVLEFDVTIRNTSPTSSNAVLSAFAFQSKYSESPALASRIGDKLFSAVRVGGTAGPMNSIKKNGTSNGLYSGKWKGICINSSNDFLSQFNAGLDNESLECAGSRTDANADGEPELARPLLGLRPGQQQTVRLRLDSGTTDGALHRVMPGTLTGIVGSTRPIDGFPTLATPGSVTAIVDFTDNKVFSNANGTFNPSFAPSSAGFSLAPQQYLTLPRRNFAFTDLLGRNHTCATYGLTIGSCAGGGSPEFGFLGVGDLVPGVQNFAALLQGFGEYVGTAGSYARPNQPYNVLCENCGGEPFVPIAEFYVDNGNGTVTRQIRAGSYGALGTAAQYTATISSAVASKFKQEELSGIDEEVEAIPEDDDPSRRPIPERFGAKASAQFSNFEMITGGGLNGGDAIAFDITIRNDSPLGSGIHLTSFNYQTKERGLADISRLDGVSQTRRDLLLDSTNASGQVPACTAANIALGSCWDAANGVAHFPNAIGNGLLFGQMVWTNADAGREPTPVDSDQVFVDPIRGRNPVPFWLESVKKNGPFTPILKGNRNFICIKSGLFDLDPDADAACAGQPAILSNPNGPVNIANTAQRLGLPPQQTQTVRMRMDFGDFRGTLMRIAPGTLTPQAAPYGLRRFFDCSDQRELEFCHPDLVGTNIGYLPGTTATWQAPASLSQVEYVITNQPGDAPTKMNFPQNFGLVMAMAGFRPSAEFYKPDAAGNLIREQVLGTYTAVAGLLDTFNTTATTLNTANWSGLTGTLNYRIVDNTLRALAGGPIGWRKQAFGPSQEASVRVVETRATDLAYTLWLKGETVNGKTNGIRVSYEVPLRRVVVDVVVGWDGNTATSARRLGVRPVHLRAGQELRARALSNGSVRVFVNGLALGDAFQAGAAFVNRGGHVGMSAIAPGARFDNFGGGNR